MILNHIYSYKHSLHSLDYAYHSFYVDFACHSNGGKTQLVHPTLPPSSGTDGGVCRLYSPPRQLPPPPVWVGRESDPGWDFSPGRRTLSFRGVRGAPELESVSAAVSPSHQNSARLCTPCRGAGHPPLRGVFLCSLRTLHSLPRCRVNPLTPLHIRIGSSLQASHFAAGRGTVTVSPLNTAVQTSRE